MNVTIKTSMGDMVLELFEKEAPVTVENFLSYAKEGFYKNTIFGDRTAANSWFI